MIRFSIRLKFSILIFALILILMGATAMVILSRVQRSTLNELRLRGQVLARNIALNSEDPLFLSNDLDMAKLTADAVKNEDIVYAFIVDDKEIIRAHSQIRFMGKGLSAFHAPGNTYQVAVPIMLAGRQKIGEVKVGIDLETIKKAIYQLQFVTLVIMVIGLVAGILGAFVLSHYLTQPINDLSLGALEIARGNFGFQIRKSTNDELGDLTDTFNRMAKSLKEKELIKDAFRRYVSHQVADEIFKNPNAYVQALKGERRRVTVMFTDIRGFTPLTVKLPPEEVVSILNRYLTNMTQVIFKYEGTIDKFLGDGLMAIFGAPISHPDDVIRAVRSAVEIQELLRMENVERQKMNKQPILVGIGINVGEAVVGNIGSQDRLDYTVIGDSVNMASRLQDLAAGEEILVSDAICEELKKSSCSFPVRLSDALPVKIKGRTEPVNVYRILITSPGAGAGNSNTGNPAET